jgi:hypothetical protein
MAMNFSFTRLSLFLAICLVCVSTAMAATTCPSTTYADYNPAPPGPGPSITCATDNLQFSQFGFTSTSSGGAVKPTPGGIGVTVEDPAVTPGLDGPGFDFNPGFSVTSNQTQDAKISFQVTALNGTTINDLFIFFNGSISNPPGGASTNYSETYCTGSFTTGCNTFQVNNPPPNLSQLITIPNATTLYITKDFTASGGTNGSASISSVINEFSSPVPEPREIGLLILAMVGLVFAHRRIKASVN